MRDFWFSNRQTHLKKGVEKRLNDALEFFEWKPLVFVDGCGCNRWSFRPASNPQAQPVLLRKARQLYSLYLAIANLDGVGLMSFIKRNFGFRSDP